MGEVEVLTAALKEELMCLWSDLHQWISYGYYKLDPNEDRRKWSIGAEGLAERIEAITR